MEKPKNYEEFLDNLTRLSPEDKQKVMDKAKEKCICAQCPSYTGTGEESLFFCGAGKSEIITEEKQCICPDCQVASDMALRWQYFCTRGGAEDQMHIEKPEAVGTLSDNTYRL